MESRKLSVFIVAIVLAMVGGASAQTEGQVNVASQFLDSCSASTTYGGGGVWDCTTLFDGIIEDGWAATDGQATAWVEFSLTQSFYVEALKVYNKASGWRVNSYTLDYWNEDSGSWEQILGSTDIGYGETVLSELPMTLASRFRLNMICNSEASCQLKEVELYATPAASEGPAAYWKFDEGTGTTTVDSSGNGNDGTLSGVASWAGGVCGNAVNIGRGSDIVDITETDNLRITGDQITLGAWVYLRSPSAYYDRVIEQLTLSEYGNIKGMYLLGLDKNGQRFRIGFRTGENQYVPDWTIGLRFSEGEIPLNTWTHIAGTYDGNSINLYMNGELDSTFEVGHYNLWDAAGYGTCTGIGNDCASLKASLPGVGLDGLIDEVIIHDYALAEEEINAIYAEGLACMTPPDADNDGVLDDVDACSGTAEGAAVNADGCSIAQLVPADGDYANKGKYVSAVAKTAEAFLEAGLISEAEKDATVSAAAKSDVGKKK